MSVALVRETIETAAAQDPVRGGTISADLTQEYAAGGAYPVLGFLRALPLAIDDVTADFGDDLYQRMLFDARVSSEVDNLRAAIIEDGLVLSPAVTEKDADGYALAATIHAAAERMLDDLETPLDDVLRDLLLAVALGNRLAEQVYEYGDLDGRTGLILAALRVKPRRTVAFVTDAYMRVVGILAQAPGQAGIAARGAIAPDAPPPNLLPRGKFVAYTHNPVDADPRGTSVLRAAYTPWTVKLQTLRDYIKYLARFASPSLVGILPPGARSQPVLDPVTGEPTGKVLRAVDAYLAQLEAFHNGTALALPNGGKVDALLAQGDGAAFLSAIGECNRDIALAVSGQTLASTEGQHNARAAAQVHQDTRDTRVRQAKKALQLTIKRDLLRQWVRVNWGDAAAQRLTPTVTLGNIEQEDMAPLIAAVARLAATDYFTPGQKAKLDVMLGLPERTPEDVAREEEAANRPPPVAPAAGTPVGTGQQGDPTADPNADPNASDGGAA